MHREKNEKPQVQNWSTAPASLKILFFHNTLPEYRIGWFCNLDKIANVDFVFTNEELNKKAIYKHVDLIFSVGRKNKEYFLSNGINKQKICWIPDVSETPECDFVDIREKYNIPKDSKLILFLGRLMPQKGVTDLITAFSMLDKDIQDSSFLLVAGNGDDMENCKKLAQKFTIKNVTFVGTVNPTDRGNFFKQCDIFVYPVAYYKGRVDVWGLTVNEAIQHGKVVIATDAVGSAYELIEDGVNGYRVEPGNVELMKNALECSMDEAIKESAIQKDAELFNEFNYINMAKKYIDAIVN